MGLSCANRLSVGCKSPLTGGIKEANAGGTVATYMADHANTGVAFGGGAQGADHTTCPSAGACADLSPEEICKLSYNIQVMFAMCEKNLMCILAWIFLNRHLDKLAALYATVYGGSASADRLLDLGAMTLKTEKEFNRAAGWKDEDDVLPEFFYTEKSEMTGATFNVPQKYMSKTVMV